MPASDLFLNVGSPGSATTLDANYTAGGTSITVVSTTNWTAIGEGVIFAMDEATVVDGQEVQTAGTYNEFEGTVASATSITNVDQKRGSGDRNYTAGSLTRVYIPVSAERENRLSQGMAVAHDQDGTLKAGAVDVAAVLGAGVVTTAKIADNAVTAEKLGTPIACRAKPSGVQTLTTSTFTNVTLGTEVYDLGGNFASSEFVAPHDGVYLITGQIGIDNVGDATAQSICRIIAAGSSVAETRTNADDAGHDSRLNVTAQVSISSGDIVKLNAFQSAGANRGMDVDSTWLAVSLIGRTD